MASDWDEIEARIVAAECVLLDPAVRADPEALERWLDPVFTEIGQSGRFWTREAVFADLLSTDQAVYETAELTEPRVTLLADAVYLLTYAVRIGERRSRRSSIWRITDGQPRMVFNQGTSLPESS
jgi:ribonuclease HI